MKFSVLISATLLSGLIAMPAFATSDEVRRAYYNAVDRAHDRIAERRELRRQHFKEARQDYRAIKSAYRKQHTQHQHAHGVGVQAHIGGIHVGAGVNYR